MKVAPLTIERELKKAGRICSYKNLRAMKDELESYNREDYSTVPDACQDAIDDLVSLGQLH